VFLRIFTKIPKRSRYRMSEQQTARRRFTRILKQLAMHLIHSFTHLPLCYWAFNLRRTLNCSQGVSKTNSRICDGYMETLLQERNVDRWLCQKDRPRSPPGEASETAMSPLSYLQNHFTLCASSHVSFCISLGKLIRNPCLWHAAMMGQ
jgi:hypothetical protein